MGSALAYLAEPYVIDVLAGWAVVVFSFWMRARIERRWDRRRSERERSARRRHPVRVASQPGHHRRDRRTSRRLHRPPRSTPRLRRSPSAVSGEHVGDALPRCAQPDRVKPRDDGARVRDHARQRRAGAPDSGRDDHTLSRRLRPLGRSFSCNGSRATVFGSVSLNPIAHVRSLSYDPRP